MPAGDNRWRYQAQQRGLLRFAAHNPSIKEFDLSTWFYAKTLYAGSMCGWCLQLAMMSRSFFWRNANVSKRTSHRLSLRRLTDMLQENEEVISFYPGSECLAGVRSLRIGETQRCLKGVC